jgi:hypothetical protein
MKKWTKGTTICYKRGDIDYVDISKDRKFYSENNDKVGCKFSYGYAACGGSTDTTKNTEFSYCYKKSDSDVNECPA